MNQIIELADGSHKYPMGVTKYMVVTHGPIKVLQDFVVMAELEGVDLPMILGKPFLKTAKSFIDVLTGMITFRVGDNHLTLKATRGLEEEEEEEEPIIVEYARSSVGSARSSNSWPSA